MNRPYPTRPRLKLSPTCYRKLWHRVLERDGWHCQDCGRTSDLQVHHIRSRSQLGDDAEMNLITLCARCHQNAHSRQ